MSAASDILKLIKEKEIEFVNNFVALQKIRTSEKTKIDYTILINYILKFDCEFQLLHPII